jgi:valyl-tRNA synthetase
MIMFGLEFTGTIPFSQIYLHGIIRDENGRKMSKSYDNIIDPVIVMDQMGTDALRFSLLVGSTAGKDMNVSTKQVEPSRNFVNKIWNASRFIITSLDKVETRAIAEPEWTLADSWIWARTQELIRNVERLFQNHLYSEGGRQLYDFFWSEFADWYLEVAKLQIMEGGDRAYYTTSTLVRVLDLCLRLLHPYIPFITEEIWGILKKSVLDSPLSSLAAEWSDGLIISSWPEPRQEQGWEKDCIANFSLLQDTIRAIRNIRSEKNVIPGKLIPAILTAGEKTDLFRQQEKIIASLAQLDPEKFEISQNLPHKQENYISIALGIVEIYLPLEGLVDRSEERERLNKAREQAKSQVDRLEKLLGSSFAERAPAEVVQKERDKLLSYQVTMENLEKQLSALD